VAAFTKAEEQAQEIVDEELEEIAVYLSTNTLCNRVSGLSNPGGRLWSRNDSLDTTLNYDLSPSRSRNNSNSMRETTLPSRRSESARFRGNRSRERDIVSCLSDLHGEVEDSKLCLHTKIAFLLSPIKVPLVWPSNTR